MYWLAPTALVMRCGTKIKLAFVRRLKITLLPGKTTGIGGDC
jgi:hypothetical protein